MKTYTEESKYKCIGCYSLDSDCDTICLLENLERYACEVASLTCERNHVQDKLQKDERQIIELAISVEHDRRKKIDINERIEELQNMLGAIREVLAAKHAVGE
ncbi:hypothetical protein [Solidesulfovibrio magneticus]|uniref:hypothetical protein n=1 Tax=Solidesulfovibrio magneticus TaxID=184917 RepID=UPI0005BB4B46|nr:hypothetical protein [Solidesulfovibrio magneticus]